MCKLVDFALSSCQGRLIDVSWSFFESGIPDGKQQDQATLFVDNSALRFFTTYHRSEPWLSFFKTTRALDNPCIIMQLCNGSTALHVLDLELSAEDLETVLQHVSNVPEFTYIDRYHSNVFRDFHPPAANTSA